MDDNSIVTAERFMSLSPCKEYDVQKVCCIFKCGATLVEILTKSEDLPVHVPNQDRIWTITQPGVMPENLYVDVQSAFVKHAGLSEIPKVSYWASECCRLVAESEKERYRKEVREDVDAIALAGRIVYKAELAWQYDYLLNLVGGK